MNDEIEQRLIAAFGQQQRGFHAEAELEFLSILAEDPDNVHAHNLLGVVCLNTGRPIEAEAHISSALRLDPEDAEAHANLCLAYKAMGKIDKAERAIRTALKLEPGRPASLAHLGSICLELGAPHEAISHLAAALKRGPPRPEWLVSLSSAYCQLVQTGPAIGAARHAIKINPNLAEAYVSLGDALLKACEYSEAGTAFHQAIAANPDLACGWIGLGTALKESGDTIEAKQILSEACQRFPSEPRCHFMLGTLHEQAGRAAEAAEEYREAISASPGYGAAYFQLLQLPGSSLKANEFSGLSSLVRESKASNKSAHVHFAMALWHEKEDCYRKAINQYVLGHRLLGRQNPYDDSRTIRFYSEIERSLHELEAARENKQGGVVTPIFVVGMPRSGTTLVEQILASHPMVGGAGESSFLEDSVRQAERLTGKAYPACLGFLTSIQAGQLRDAYLERLGRSFAGKSHIVDKTPMNFQYVGLVRRILPQARVIHCKRNALETCISIFRLPFDPSQAYAHDLQALGTFYGHYRQLMERTEQLMAQIVSPVHLDNLIDNPDQVVRNLCEFVGLAFDGAMLNFHEAQRLVRTPSAMQVREPLRRAPKRWGDHFGEAVAPLIDALGHRP